MVVGTSLPDQSAVRRGTSISRPSTLTLIFSIAGEAGFISVVAAVDISIQFTLPRFLRQFCNLLKNFLFALNKILINRQTNCLPI